MLLRNRLAVRLRTGRHYRPTQLLAYGLDRALRVAEASATFDPRELTRLARGPAEPARGALAAWGTRPEATALAPPWRPQEHGDPRRSEWRFQEVSATFEGLVDWASWDKPKLWRFHLHYLDTPAALAAALPDDDWQPWLAELLDDHWRRCRPGRGDSWQAFPLAIRQQNLLRIWASLEARGGAAPELDRALARHTRAGFHYLRARLEHHLRGNHLLKERCVLTCSARIWAGPGALRGSLVRLRRQVESQFLAGGGHEERSLRYHLDCLRDLAEVRAALGAPSPAWLETALTQGLDFAAALEHPDGQVPLFNDAELGMAHPRATLSGLLGHEPPRWTGVRRFDEEGYFSARTARSHLVFDCGAIGPDHQPAHAHCDILSFELSVDGRRLVGNRGTLAYGAGPDRDLSRCTASHNTVQIGDGEQVEIWSGFRVGWRGRPELIDARQSELGPRLAGRYRWDAKVGAEHLRTLTLCGEATLEVDDEVRFERTPRTLASRLHLPDALLLSSGPQKARFRTGEIEFEIRVERATLQVASSDWFPRMGVRRPGQLATVVPDRGAPRCSFKTTISVL